jgi:glutamate 5-kinase
LAAYNRGKGREGMIRIENMQGTGRVVELRRLVVKLGSAVVTGTDDALDEAALGSLADGVAWLRASGVKVILVSSGAIAMGRRLFSDFRPRTIPDRQALAAIGQVGLMNAYKELFNARGFRAAQLLLTRDDMDDRSRYLNIRYALDRLLDLGVVPVINENDTVTIDELKFGDNDELSALVASRMEADLLILLSTVDGLHAGGDPTRRQGVRAKGESPGAKAGPAPSAAKPAPVPFVEKIDEAILGMAGATRSAVGTGGMASKLAAMRLVAQAGVHGVIACGKTPGILGQIASGRFTGTYFAPSASARRLGGRERWIAFGRRPKGQLVVDAGACQALVTGKKSLLAAGVVEARGAFRRGDLVEILGPDGKLVARGLCSFSSEEVEKIKGKKTAQIGKILGEVDYQEVVHRDNMTTMTSEG